MALGGPGKARGELAAEIGPGVACHETLGNGLPARGSPANDRAHRIATGVLLIAAPLSFMAAFTVLQVDFEYPAILRQPAAAAMEKFVAGGSALVATWYVMVVAAVSFVPIPVMLQPYLAREGAPHVAVATVLGVTAGVVQTLGFIRWPFLVPALASAHLDPSTSEASRAAIEVTFTAFNRYAGVGVGEHLGFLFTALWSFLVSLAMPRSWRSARWLGWMGRVAAVGILLGTLEPLGVPLAGAVNALAYVVWAGWLVLLGVRLIRGPEAA